jgi:Asp/Glu/hydantoin racemase
MSGDAAKHDEMVAKALKELMKEVDVIVLAQASMARVVDGLSAEEKLVPILASPAIAMKKLAKLYFK